MTEPMVTDEDREIARRWLSEGQINVDQLGQNGERWTAI